MNKHTSPPPSAPDSESVSQLLRDRWSIPMSEHVGVSFAESPQQVEAQLISDKTVYTFVLKNEAEHQELDEPSWHAMIDALDGLIGQFEEQGRQHRALPTGPGVQFDDQQFTVEVHKHVPQLDELADKLLSKTSASPPQKPKE